MTKISDTPPIFDYTKGHIKLWWINNIDDDDMVHLIIVKGNNIISIKNFFKKF
jgi:hypothetical protein